MKATFSDSDSLTRRRAEGILFYFLVLFTAAVRCQLHNLETFFVLDLRPETFSTTHRLRLNLVKYSGGEFGFGFTV